jgi:hypothetical protein
MKPIGLTMKDGRNRYRLENRGELMLIHECIECGALSINRIAADDDPASLVAVFQASFASQIHSRCAGSGIQILTGNDADALHKQLFGEGMVRRQTW